MFYKKGDKVRLKSVKEIMEIKSGLDLCPQMALYCDKEYTVQCITSVGLETQYIQLNDVQGYTWDSAWFEPIPTTKTRLIFQVGDHVEVINKEHNRYGKQGRIVEFLRDDKHLGQLYLVDHGDVKCRYWASEIMKVIETPKPASSFYLDAGATKTVGEKLHDEYINVFYNDLVGEQKYGTAVTTAHSSQEKCTLGVADLKAATDLMKIKLIDDGVSRTKSWYGVFNSSENLPKSIAHPPRISFTPPQ